MRQDVKVDFNGLSLQDICQQYLESSSKMEDKDCNLNSSSTQNRELTSEVGKKIEAIKDDATEISTGSLTDIEIKTLTTKEPGLYPKTRGLET